MQKSFNKWLIVTALLSFGGIGVNMASAATAPVITVQPANVTVTAPAAATFTVTATGTSLTYQWEEFLGAYYGWQPIPGATSTTYKLPLTTIAENGIQYECIVSNALGTVTSSPALLTVNLSLSITTQPVNVTVTAPATATFTVAASGTGLSYQWEEYTGPFAGWYAIPGAYSASLTTQATSVVESGFQFRCVVTNASGSVTSTPATLTVNTSLNITTQPANVTVIAPAKASFSVVAAGPGLSYQWLSFQGSTGWALIPGATSATYTIPSTTLNESGIQYECVVTNASGKIISAPATLTVNMSLSITTQPASLTVNAPSTATFAVAASGTGLSYQWVEFQGSTGWVQVPGATSASYTTPPTSASFGWVEYACVVSNASGSITSSIAALTINVLPTISSQPVNELVQAPSPATFTVAASGPGLSYQWESYQSSTGWTAIPGANSASYTTPATSAASSGTQYECIISNPAGNVTSSIATLTVNSSIGITTQPANAAVITPTNATFTVAATSALPLSYQWMVKAPAATSFSAISGATSTSYTTPATTTANNGTQYECVISNSSGSVTSNTVILTVTPVVPSITTQPANVTVTAPAKATFTITASGTGLSYQWLENYGYIGWLPISGATKASYTTPVTTIAMNGAQYECVVSNASGSVTSAFATLTVNMSFSIITQPVNTTVTAPAKAVFTVAATGTGLTYQWNEYTNFGWVPQNGATAATFTTPATSMSNNGTMYECVVTNTSGSITTVPVTLTVNPAVIAPVITTEPANVTVTAPTKATFTLAATGTGLTYQWEENLGFYVGWWPISGATKASYTTPATTGAMSGIQYECIVSNAGGSVTSTAVTLTANMSLSITTQPANVTAISPAPATFTVTASGPSLTYQWEVLQSNYGWIPIAGAISASYTTPATTVDSNGAQYECIVSNTSGSLTSSPATLTVYTLPTITTQPVNASVTAPLQATYTVAAINSTSQPSYQWQVKTPGSGSYTAISGATSSSYTTVPTTLALNGALYECVVSNAAGSVISNPATLSVAPEPLPTVTIINPANNGSFTTGSINITALTAESVGAVTSVAFYNGSTLLGTVASNSPAFTYPWTNLSAGTYTITAQATDSTGSTVTSTPITFTITAAPYSSAVDNDLLSKTDALGHETSFQYDKDHRLLKTTFADGSTVSFAYDLFGNQLSVTDQRGNTLTKTYDAYERLVQTRDPLGGITQFSYDTNGDLLTLTDADNHSTSYTYDGDYRVLTQSNALNLTTSYAYDPNGNVSARTDANGKTVTYTYDALNRLTNIAYPDGTSVANGYDAIGRKTTMTDSTGQTSYAYDAVNELLSKTSPGTNNTIAYTYDSEGNRLTSVDQNNRTITNAYDALNRLSSVTDPNGTTNYLYDAVSNEASVKTPNGVTESYTYDALNRVLSDVNANGTGVISSFSNVYDIAGMITKKTLQDGSWTAYSYDALNRLLEETKQTSSSIVYDYAYTYDPVGNRLTWTKNTTLGSFWSIDSLNMPPQVLTNMTGSGYGSTANPAQATTLARSYSYDAANRLTGWNYGVNIYSASFPVQTDSYSYDNNGNRLTKQATLTGVTNPEQTNYGYDFENRLTSLNYTNIPSITGTQTDSLTYNGEGLRTGAVLNSVASNYSYDGFNILVERDGSGNTTKSYTRGLDLGGGIGSLIDQNIPGTTPVTQYYDYNDLGSVADTTTTAGTSANSYSYDAFGNLLAPQATTDTNRYLFSTKESDARSGLVYFGARYYDPEIGRWLTQDPLGFVDGLNLYAYVENNPVNLIDPDGFDSVTLNPSETGPDLNPGSGGGSETMIPGDLPSFQLPPMQSPNSSSGNSNGQDPEWNLHAPDLGGKENTNIGEESFDNICGNGIICSSREAERDGDKIKEGKELTPEEAADRLNDGKDVVSDTEQEAKDIATSAGGGNTPVGPENHSINYKTGLPKPGDWLSHYHTNGHGKGHSWYY